jgi:transposase
LIPDPPTPQKHVAQRVFNFTTFFSQPPQLLQFWPKMRGFGLKLSPNVRSIQGNCRELTNEERASIVTARMAGVPRSTVAANFNCTRLTVTRTCNHFQLYGTVESLPRKGRPRKLDQPHVRYIECMIKRNPHIGRPALYSGSPSGVSMSTIRRSLSKRFKRKWRSIKRINLTTGRAANRLAHGKDLKGKEAIVLEVCWLTEVVLVGAANWPFFRGHTLMNLPSKPHQTSQMAGSFACQRINITKTSSISRPESKPRSQSWCRGASRREGGPR